MKRTVPHLVRISMGVEVAKFVKVRAYKRLVNGKNVRVWSHYRKVLGYLM